jgi:hypothetical protein
LEFTMSVSREKIPISVTCPCTGRSVAPAPYKHGPCQVGGLFLSR